jgi:hypothetical protein
MRGFIRVFGPAGIGQSWHHIVEQRPANVAQFGRETLNSAGNLIRVPNQIHNQISGYYSSIQEFSQGMRVRDWLNGQTLQDQYQFGMSVLRKFGVQP